MQTIRRIISGWSVSKIIIVIILSFRVGTYKNKNIDHQGKETCMFGLPILNESSAIYALLPFLFDFFELKEKDHIGSKMNSQKRKCLYEKSVLLLS